MSRRATHTRRWKFLQGLGKGMNGSASPLYYLASNVVSKSNENLNYTEENSHLCPESLPQAAGIGETELPLEPDEQPAEAEIQVARFLERGNHTGHGDLCQRKRIKNHRTTFASR